MIYILEDDASIRELVTYAVEGQGMTIAGYERPSDFWKALEAQLPELILLDIMLPEEDGLSILKKLRTNGRWRSVPVIMLTAKNTEFDKVMGLSIVKHGAQLHHANIGLHSEPGAGTAITIIF